MKPKEKIVRYTVEELKKMGPSNTDWARLDAMKDEDIDYSDSPECDESFWANAKIVAYHPPKKPVSIRVDEDVLTWFKKQKGRYQKLMNAVLRQYMNAHKKKPYKRKTTR